MTKKASFESVSQADYESKVKGDPILEKKYWSGFFASLTKKQKMAVILSGPPFESKTAKQADL